MRRASAAICAFVCVLLFCVSVVPPAKADKLGPERDKIKMILNVVSKEIEKEYYDPKMHGVDWKAATDEARQKIDKAEDIGSMMTAIYALVGKLHDSHTYFLPPSRSNKYLFGFEAQMYGDEARIYRVKKNSPAERAGLKVGDKIASMNGHVPDRPSFGLMLLYYRILRPAPFIDMDIVRAGQATKIRVQPDVHQQPAVLQISDSEDLFELIHEENVSNEEYRSTHQFVSGMQDGIGYVHLPYFSSHKEFLQGVLEDSKGAKAIIVDLRGNGGGSVDTLGTFAGFFESESGSIADLVLRKETKPIKFKPMKPNFQVPMFILIDSRSASASEIFAYHFQKTKHAVVIGDDSEGAVMVARGFPEEIGAGSVIYFGTQITVGRVVFPGGVELENSPVKPDKPCLPTSEAMAKGEDTCLALARSLAKEAIEKSKNAEPAKN